MSGCINCVWELFDEDLKDWDAKRKQAAERLVFSRRPLARELSSSIKTFEKRELPSVIGR